MAEHPMVLYKTPHVLSFIGLSPTTNCPTDCPIDCPRDCPQSAHSVPSFKTHNSHRSASNSICYHRREARPHSPVAMGAKGSSRTVCLVGRQLFVHPHSSQAVASNAEDLYYPILPLKIYYRLMLGLCNPSPETFQA